MLAYIQFPAAIREEIIPGLPFRWYGLMYLIAFSITFILFMVQIRQRKLNVSNDDAMNFFFAVIIGLLIGARLFSTLLFDPSMYYWKKPWMIFWPFNETGQFTGLAGMNFYGGVFGGILVAVVYSRIKKIDLLDWSDMVATAIPLGYSFGRLGNFINGELYGRLTSAPWGVIFPHARAVPVTDPAVQEIAAKAGMDLTTASAFINMPRHPTQIYELILEGIVSFLIMWFVLRKRRPFKGFLLGAYVFLYGFFRFWVDYLRTSLTGEYLLTLKEDPNPIYLFESFGNFIPSQLYSLLMIAGSVLFIWAMGKRHQSELASQQTTEEGKDKAGKSRKIRKKLKR